jgi:hypothetical protein
MVAGSADSLRTSVLTNKEPIPRSAAIMQPYFFPYVGYYQMASAVERFLVYDDVQYIKGGYIPRNKLLINGKEWTFTVPLSGASPNLLIKDVRIDMKAWPQWKERLLRTIEQNYRKASNYVEGRTFLEQVLELNDDRISTLAQRSVSLFMKSIGRRVKFQNSSDLALGQDLRFEDRLLHICRHEKIGRYIQSQGGVKLYSSERWQREGLSLEFIRPTSMDYPRKGNWVPGLSMLDAMLHVPFHELDHLMDKYELFTN